MTVLDRKLTPDVPDVYSGHEWRGHMRYLALPLYVLGTTALLIAVVSSPLGAHPKFSAVCGTASAISLYLGLAIYVYQRRDLALALSDQTQKLERLSTELLRKFGEGVQPISLEDALGLTEKWINGEASEFVYASRFSAIPLFWHKRDDALRFAAYAPDSWADRKVKFIGPVQPELDKLVDSVVASFLRGERTEPRVISWCERVLQSNGGFCGVWNPEEISNNREPWLRWIREQNGLTEQISCAMRTELLKDYEALVAKAGQCVSSSPELSSHALSNIVAVKLREKNRFGSDEEMLIFDLDSLLADTNTTLPPPDWTEDLFKPPHILLVQHPLVARLCRYQIDKLLAS